MYMHEGELSHDHDRLMLNRANMCHSFFLHRFFVVLKFKRNLILVMFIS